ncbi:MAG: hypothetical protein ACXQTN_01660 [Methanoculleaceae archaeon]
MTPDTMYARYVVHIGTAAIFQLIPAIGPTLLMVALVLIALSQGDLRGVALLTGAGYPVVCAFPDLWFRPVMNGQARIHPSIHPALMWIGFFGGLAVMGLGGFVLGPLHLALTVACYRIPVGQQAAPHGAA